MMFVKILKIHTMHAQIHVHTYMHTHTPMHAYTTYSDACLTHTCTHTHTHDTHTHACRHACVYNIF